MEIRPYKIGDAPELATIFFRSVRETGLRDYTPVQVLAWAPKRPDPSRVHVRAQDGRLTLVATDENGRPIAYGDLEASGHIDHLYCLPDHVGAGVGSAVYDALELEALRAGAKKISVDASEAARRLFERKGFQHIRRQDFEIRGVQIHNFRMEKVLGVVPPSASPDIA